jgi:DNA polymerase III sliding clamp (beta) subunit (PCNA family)
MTAFTIAAADLADALANVLPHADTGGHLPVLNAVRVEVEADGLVIFVATDRYSLAMQEVVSLADADVVPGEFLLHRTDAVDIVKKAKATKLGKLVFTHEGFDLTVTAPGMSTTLQTVDGEFPKFRSLLPTGDPVAVDTIGLGSQNLAKFAKLQQHGRTIKNASLVVCFRSATKPVDVTVRELDGFRSIVMPLRLQGVA